MKVTNQMTSYLIEVEQNILQVGFNPEISATGERIVKDTSEILKSLISSSHLPKTKILKINGRSSVLVSYVLAHELGHLYSVIAVSDPRLEDCFVVTISYDPNYKVGDIIDSNNLLVKAKNRVAQDISSVTLKLEKDTLKVNFNPEVIATGDRIVRDMAVELDKAIASEQIQGGKLLKIRVSASQMLLTARL
jgi:CRISPR-associated protein Csx3